MHMVMYYSIHTYVYTYIHFHWKEHEHANERQIVSRSQCALPVSTTLLRRWYHVNPVLTTLPLGPYHALWRLRSYYVDFEHVKKPRPCRSCRPY